MIIDLQKLLIFCIFISPSWVFSQVIECAPVSFSATGSLDGDKIDAKSDCKECGKLVVDVSFCKKDAVKYYCEKDLSDNGGKHIKETQIRRDTGDAFIEIFYQSADKLTYSVRKWIYGKCEISKIKPKF